MRAGVAVAEVHVAESALREHHGLIGEMGRLGIAALAAAHERLGPYRGSELHRADETVAHRAVDLPGLARLRRVERGEGTPLRGRESHRQAGFLVVEGLHDVVGDALKAIDLTPGCIPAAEVAFEPAERGAHR